MRARLVAVSLIVLLVVSAGFGFASKGSATRLTQVIVTPTALGVFADSTGNAYIDGINGVQSYFGSGGKNVNLVTYSTPRKIRLKFDTSEPAWQASGLPADMEGTVDLYGINYYGYFTSMGFNTTAKLQTSLQFKAPDGVTTWELRYETLAVKRFDATSWRVTNDFAQIGVEGGVDGVPASDAATLTMIRKRGSVVYGTVHMPITYDINILQ